ncbi:unnamed protein product [Clavelina lepadiformis]|uniref:Uncharacterized protein n=1 Tax=Clavelina lepadiformis TaxID=159417 RepID=A0ABP0H2B7_CLALP
MSTKCKELSGTRKILRNNSLAEARDQVPADDAAVHSRPKIRMESSTVMAIMSNVQQNEYPTDLDRQLNQTRVKFLLQEWKWMIDLPANYEST